MSKTGYYSISKIPGTLACTFSPPNSKRFKNLTFESIYLTKRSIKLANNNF